MSNEITLNGVTYIPKPTPASGTRAVLVIDRGWIFAGNVHRAGDGTVTLTEAVHVFRWESIGFDGMLADPTSDKVTLKRMPYRVQVPAASIIFQVPVRDDWGL